MQTWNLRRAVLIFGVAQISQWGFDGGFKVTIEPDWETKVGGNGNMVRHAVNKPGAKIEITLPNTAPDNDVLSAIAALDALTGEGILPLALFDPNGRRLLACEAACIVKRPDWEGTTETKESVWEIMCENVTYVAGGS